MPADGIRLIFALVFLSASTGYEPEYAEDEIVGAQVTPRWSKLYLQPSASELLDLEDRIPMVVHEEAPVNIEDPDGASGAPVFFVYQDKSEQAHLGFAGMITDASKAGRFMLYDAAVIQSILEKSEM